MQVDCDVVVIGAGPAGATAARTCAEHGCRVVLVDRADFPREKPCAGWVNAGLFDEFPRLAPRRERLVRCAFNALTFHDGDWEKEATYRETGPTGFQVLRPQFDTELLAAAGEAGVTVRTGVTVTDVKEDPDTLTVTFADGHHLRARACVGADGVASTLARTLNIRPQFGPADGVICANEVLAVDPDWIEAKFGPDRSAHVTLAYAGISGYAWIFPKTEHVAIGLGGRKLQPGEARMHFDRYFHEAKSHGLLPPTAESKAMVVFPDPAGMALRCERLVTRRTVLVGDAGGFVSAKSGEGILPAMISGRIAAELVTRGLTQNRLEEELAGYDATWRARLEKPLAPPGPALLFMLGMMFSDARITSRIARSFLYGEPI